MCVCVKEPPSLLAFEILADANHISYFLWPNAPWGGCHRDTSDTAAESDCGWTLQIEQRRFLLLSMIVFGK